MLGLWKKITLTSILKPVFLTALALFAILPFWWLLASSLRGGDVYTAKGLSLLIPQEITLEYYKSLLFDTQSQLPLGRFFINTIIICFFGVLLEVALASLAAFPLARIKFRGKGLVMALMAGALMLPNQASMIVNFVTIRSLGLFDTLIAVILPGCVSIFGIFLMRQAFLVIPEDLLDAARLDGCGHWDIFWKIMLPLTRPSQGALALFAFVSHWNSFMWPLVVLKSADLYPLSVGMAYLAQTFDSDFRMVAAGSVLGTLPIIIIFLLIQKQFIKGITAGALK